MTNPPTNLAQLRAALTTEPDPDDTATRCHACTTVHPHGTPAADRIADYDRTVLALIDAAEAAHASSQVHGRMTLAERKTIYERLDQALARLDFDAA